MVAQESDGVIWISSGSRLIKASSEQLRVAQPVERLTQEIVSEMEGVPISELVASLRRGEYIDITAERVPTEDDNTPDMEAEDEDDAEVTGETEPTPVAMPVPGSVIDNAVVPTEAEEQTTAEEMDTVPEEKPASSSTWDHGALLKRSLREQVSLDVAPPSMETEESVNKKLRLGSEPPWIEVKPKLTARQ